MPIRSADDPEANGLTERFMQMVGKSWATAFVEGKDPLAALNQMLKSYRNSEHSVTKRKPAEWLFGRPLRTRLPQLLQTQCEDKDAIAARERIRERGAEEKRRHDRKAREEEIRPGMQVLLKYKKKKKGMPRYDPRPFTVTELSGRQAVLKRGNTLLKRETEKFKRFYPDFQEGRPEQAIDDDWEEGQTISRTEEGKNGTPRTAERNESSSADQANSTVTVPDNMPLPDQTVQTDTAATVAPRRSNRPRTAPNRLGEWAEK